MESAYIKTPIASFNEEQINTMLGSPESGDVIDGFFYTVKFGTDYYRSEQLLLHFLEDDDAMLRMASIVLISAFAETHGRINFTPFFPHFERMLNLNSDSRFEDLERALLNIWVYCKSTEVLTLDNATTTGRFYSALKMCDAFEAGKKFKEGIAEFKRLKKKEKNASVTHILNQSITYLTNNLVGSN